MSIIQTMMTILASATYAFDCRLAHKITNISDIFANIFIYDLSGYVPTYINIR